MDVQITESLRHSLTVTDSSYSLTMLAGPAGPASTVAGPTGPAGATGATGAAGPNSITSATTSDGNADIEVNTLDIATSLTMNGDQSFVDSKKAIFGTGSDLQIYHDNTQSRIQAEHNDLWIVSEQADACIKFFADSGTGATPEEYLRVDGLNEVTEFKKNIRFSDDVKIQVGASQDLEIFHESGNSYIDDKGAGNLNIRGANLNLQKYTGETFVTCVADGAVSLYHDNASKLSTSATGVAVTGNVDLASGNVAIASGNFTTGNGNIVVASGNIAVGTGSISVATGSSSAPQGYFTNINGTDLDYTDIKASAILGYSSGGAVTQTTNFLTTVSLNAPSGVITCLSQTFAANDSEKFTFNNTSIGINDVVVVSLQEGDGKLFASVAATAAGSCVLTVGNSSASPVTVAPKINFAVIKTATS